MQLALFDLDHTLIPFDSGSVFTRHLIAEGVLPPSFADDYLEWCRRYAAGTVDMAGMHRYTVGALAEHPPQRLQALIDAFAAGLPARVPAASRALLQRHRDAGHHCLLVTATSRLVSAPFARAIGFDPVEELLATEPVRDARGHVTGEIVGEPCFREHKATHVDRWLAARGRSWADVTRSWFYSDSMNDLPLLQRVSDPVAVNADPRLAAHARAQGWPQLTLQD